MISGNIEDLLTEKQKKFCIEYTRTNNAKQSYLFAYDSAESTANTNASKLLKNPKVIKYLNKIKKPILEQDKETAIATAQDVLLEFTKILKKSSNEKTRLEAGKELLKAIGWYDREQKDDLKAKELELLEKLSKMSSEELKKL